jgi:hypothetical protein
VGRNNNGEILHDRSLGRTRVACGVQEVAHVPVRA